MLPSRKCINSVSTISINRGWSGIGIAVLAWLWIKAMALADQGGQPALQGAAGRRRRQRRQELFNADPFRILRHGLVQGFEG